jgi:hypothetical protein
MNPLRVESMQSPPTAYRPAERGNDGAMSTLANETVGAIVRSAKNEKTTFALPGHLIDEETSEVLVGPTPSCDRHPTCMLQEHRSANRLRAAFRI